MDVSLVESLEVRNGRMSFARFLINRDVSFARQGAAHFSLAYPMIG